MKQKFKDTPSALFSKNSSCNSDSDTKKSDDVDSESEYYVDLVSCVAKIVKHFGILNKISSVDQWGLNPRSVPQYLEFLMLKYKRPVGSFKKQNVGSKVRIVEEKEWVKEEDSYDEDVKKDACLMEFTLWVFHWWSE